MTTLSQVELFSGLPQDVLEQMKALLKRVRISQGEVLFKEGDAANGLYLIQKGRVKVYVAQDHKEFILNIQGAGEAVGELSLLDDEPRSATVVAMEACDLLYLSKDDFNAWIDQEPRIARTIIIALTQHIRRMTDKIRGLALQDVYSRVRGVLESLAGAPDTDGLRYIPDRLTQQDIADRVGSSREMIARILKELVLGEYIAVENRHVTLLKKLPERF